MSNIEGKEKTLSRRHERTPLHKARAAKHEKGIMPAALLVQTLSLNVQGFRRNGGFDDSICSTDEFRGLISSEYRILNKECRMMKEKKMLYHAFS
jgi:hypothetical protein